MSTDDGSLPPPANPYCSMLGASRAFCERRSLALCYSQYSNAPMSGALPQGTLLPS
jgi:hypothetical protein